ncbi:hypothetical protein BDF22DRAFT_744663 [Syncephalis plumigaleata]|nr:hypothetical protein BDF22DRAFT_744663 [Syncephalis plumigaleata]
MHFFTASVALLASVATLLSTVDAGFYERDMLCKVNDWRARNGKTYFVYDEGLKTVAQNHNTLQVKYRQMRFQFPGEEALGERINKATGKNDWRGYSQLMGWNYKTNEAFAKAMATESPKQYFDGDYTHFALIRDDANGESWWTMVMAKKPGFTPTNVKCRPS